MATASSPFSTRGIVHAAAGLEKFSLSRFTPGPQLKPFVDHFWVVRYDLPAGTTHTQTVLSYPNVHLAFEHDEGRRALVYGIPRRPFVRELRGTGRTLGVRVRAGGFFPFWRRDVAQLTGKTVPATHVFGPQAEHWADTVLDAGDDAAMARAAERLLSACLPDPDPRAELAAQIVSIAMDERDIIKAEQLSERTDMSLRRLQRLFRRYVGVGPKWVIKRFRLQEAAERIEHEPDLALTDLAVELGYFDQAHFIKDFKAVLGQTPAEYRTAARHALGARRGEGASENEQGSDARAPVPGLDKRPGRAVES